MKPVILFVSFGIIILISFGVYHFIYDGEKDLQDKIYVNDLQDSNVQDEQSYIERLTNMTIINKPKFSGGGGGGGHPFSIPSSSSSSSSSSNVQQIILSPTELYHSETKSSGKDYQLFSITGLEADTWDVYVSENRIDLTLKDSATLPASIKLRKANTLSELSSDSPQTLSIPANGKNFYMYLDGETNYYKLGDNSIIIESLPYVVNASTSIKQMNGSLHQQLTGNFSLQGDYGLVFYDGFDLMDFNDTNNLTYDYSDNNITGQYLPGTYYNQSTGVIGGMGYVGDNIQGEHQYCVDTGYGLECISYNYTPVIEYGKVPKLEFEATKPYSLSVWLKPINISLGNDEIRLISYLGDSSSHNIVNGWSLSISNYSTIHGGNYNVFEHCLVSSNNTLPFYTCVYSGDNSVRYNEWNHVVILYNGTNTADGRTIFVNGIESKETRCGGTGCSAVVTPIYNFNMPIGENATFRIGVRDERLGVRAGVFSVDELMIFNTTLSSANVQEIFGNYSNRFSPISNVTFTRNINQSDYHKANISLTNWEINFSSNLSLIINNGMEKWFENGKIYNYNLSNLGDLNNANITINFRAGNGSYNNFITPIIKGNISIDLFDNSSSESTPPIVYLIAPTNNTETKFDVNSFNGTFSDNVGLYNATLFIWNNTGEIINQTDRSISGTNEGLNISVTLPYYGTFFWNYLVSDTSGNLAWNHTNFTLRYTETNNIQLNNVTILGVNGGRSAKVTVRTDNRSIRGYDSRDAQFTSQASNYTAFYSRNCPTAGLCNIQLDTTNVTDLPRKFNLTYFSNPAMASGSLLNLTWIFSQANMNVTLRDYGTDTTFTTPVADGVDMNTNVEYSTTLSSARVFHYFSLEVTPL